MIIACVDYLHHGRFDGYNTVGIHNCFTEPRDRAGFIDATYNYYRKNSKVDWCGQYKEGLRQGLMDSKQKG